MRNGPWLISGHGNCRADLQFSVVVSVDLANGGSMVAILAIMPKMGMAPKAKLGTGSRNSRQTSLRPSPTPAYGAPDPILFLAADSRTPWSFIFLSGCRISRPPLMLTNTNTIYGQLARARVRGRGRRILAASIAG